MQSDDTTLVVECDLPEPPEKVWRALTTPELLAQWLTPEDGTTIECEVIEAKPNHLLRYSWRDADGSGDGSGSLDSIVTFELRAYAGRRHSPRIIHTAFEQTPALALAA